MARTVPEWIGKIDDTPVPPRVKLRVLVCFDRRCDPAHGGCGRPIRPGDAWICDHVQAIINGGPNRESNLHPLCDWCHTPKTSADMAEKSDIYRKELRHAGIKLRPIGRPLMGTIASGWRKRMNGKVERRTRPISA